MDEPLIVISEDQLAQVVQDVFPSKSDSIQRLYAGQLWEALKARTRTIETEPKRTVHTWRQVVKDALGK